VALREAVHAGLVFRLDGAYKFLHDRIQQSAYSLIPEECRAELHLRLGRTLLARMPADERAEHLFSIANQLNRGSALLVDRDEKAKVALINLHAGRKAKASVAYASACMHFGAGMALLDESDWDGQYDLMFSLWFERAECEFLSSNFDAAERLTGELLQRAASKVDQADACRLRVQLHEVRAEYGQAVTSALPCLRLLGMDIPTHPTWEQVLAEYETVWRNLGGRPIENLIDLPLITDPELQAAIRLLSVLLDDAYYADFHLFCLFLCRLINISIQHGMIGASVHALGWFGNILGAVFRRYREGFSFAKLSCDLVEKHGFIAYQARVHLAMHMVAIWTRPIASALDSNRAAFRAAIETGDLTYACYSLVHTITDLLLRNDSLDAVWRESETALDFVRKARYHEMVDGLLPMERFIAAMRGRTKSLSTFSDAQFDEAAFEARLTSDRMSSMVCYYWISKLKLRFLAGDHAEALAAADSAKALLWAATGQVYLLDYFYYSALAVAALYETASADEQIGWRAHLSAHREQLREWAETYPPTFADKHTLVSAEIARLEGRDRDAMRLYERAIQLAREQNFAQYEGVAHELAAVFYLARGCTTAGRAHLEEARSCFAHWGADGKVRQLDQCYLKLREEPRLRPSTTVFDIAVANFDAATVIKASQAVSGEIVADRLIGALMTIALEHAGAERGLLILPHGNGYRIEAEARTRHGTVEVTLRQADVTEVELPESVLYAVVRTQQSVILYDASVQNPFFADEYFRQKHARSVLCLPLVKQTKLIGLLYLENNLASHVFTSGRISVLELLASQAAISLENTHLYADLQEREAKVRRLVDSNIIGVTIWDLQGRIIEANDAFLDTVGYTRADLVSDGLRWTELTPAEWHDADASAVAELQATGTVGPFEKAYVRKDGRRVPVLIGAAMFGDRRDQGVAFVLDLTERKQTEGALHEAQAALAHVNRITMMGQLTASIAHEVNQPIAAIVANAHAGLLWLDASPPDLAEVRQALEGIVKDGDRAGNVVSRIRDLVKKMPPRDAPFDINELLLEVVALTRSELLRNRVSLETRLQEGLPLSHGDRVRLQQAVLNLIFNAIEAMGGVDEGPRALLIKTEKQAPDRLLIAVRDSGPELDAANLDRMFDAFYTTKPGGMGMGLSICRSVVEAHGGRLWATANVPRGATFQFTLPAIEESVS
jgi:PAS domain S-box-containing protein